MTDKLIHEIKLQIRAWNNIVAENEVQGLILKGGANLGDDIMNIIENHETMVEVNRANYKGSVSNGN